MRVSYTSLAVAALLFVTACGTNSPQLVAPNTTSANTVAGDGGAGLIGSGNAIATDTTATTNSTAERGGLGLMGSGN